MEPADRWLHHNASDHLLYQHLHSYHNNYTPIPFDPNRSIPQTSPKHTPIPTGAIPAGRLRCRVLAVAVCWQLSGFGCAVARLAASARTTLSSARTSHRPRSLVTLMAKRFSTPRTDRKNASRLRARSFEASHTTHSDSQNIVAAAQFSALHAWSRRTSSSERHGRIALKDLLVVMLY